MFVNLNYLYMCCALFGNAAVVSFCMAIMFDYFPLASVVYLFANEGIVTSILHFSGSMSSICFLLMHFIIGDFGFWGGFLFSLGFLISLQLDIFLSCLFFQVKLLAIYDIMLIDLLNMFLSLPGNLLYFVPTFKPYFSQVFIRDWFGKTHVFRLL